MSPGSPAHELVGSPPEIASTPSGAWGRGRLGERGWLGLIREHAPVLILSAVAVAILVILTRSATFFHDEWFYIGRAGYDVGRSLTDPASWFRPHNEHLVALHVIVYMSLQAVFGLATYQPYLLVLFATQVGLAFGLYALVDRHVGRGPALACAASILFLGSGYLDIFWAFQMGFVGAVALALWAVLFARTRPGMSAGLMALAILTQGTALFVAPAIGIYGRTRRAWAAASVPVVIYGVWWLAIGRASMNVRGQPPTISAGALYLADGIAKAAGALSGWPSGIGVVLLATAGVAVWIAWRRGYDVSAAAVGGSSLLTMYAILAISRQGFADPGDPHFLYLGAAFMLPIFATAWRVVPRAGRPAVILLVILALVVNAGDLVRWSRDWSAYIGGG